jgi:hypothetical protein
MELYFASGGRRHKSCPELTYTLPAKRAAKKHDVISSLTRHSVGRDQLELRVRRQWLLVLVDALSAVCSYAERFVEQLMQ